MTHDNEEPSAASAGSMANRQTKHDGSPEPTAHLPNTGHAVCRSRESDAGTGDIVEQRWIPVTERLPDRNANVLVWIPSGNDRTFIASLDEGGMWFSSDPTADAYTLGEDGAPTHWMPLPAPPPDAK